MPEATTQEPAIAFTDIELSLLQVGGSATALSPSLV
jgi:hypothetical protein